MMRPRWSLIPQAGYGLALLLAVAGGSALRNGFATSSFG